MSSIYQELMAPCGMNCGICMAYLREKNRCLGCREILVLDPDGYLLRFSEELGEKDASSVYKEIISALWVREL